MSHQELTAYVYCMCVSKRYVLKRTYGMCKICNVRMPHAIGNVISGIGIGIAVVDSMGIGRLHGIDLTLSVSHNVCEDWILLPACCR